MSSPPDGLRADNTIRAAADRFATGRESVLPVADGSGRYLGTLAAHDVMDALAAGETTDITALTRGVEPLRPDSSIGEALKLLDDRGDGVPVADTDGNVIGWVRHRDVLSALVTPPSTQDQRAIPIAEPPPLAEATSPG